MGELFLVFLRIGTIGYGGPIALISLIAEEVCNKKKWLTAAEFNEIFSICKLLPGPVAIQVAICVGYRRYGRIGGLVSGIAFTITAFVLMTILSIVYVHSNFVTNIKTHYLLRFMQDSTLAILAVAVWDIGNSYIRSKFMIVLTIIASIIIFKMPTYEVIVILLFGITGVIMLSKKNVLLSIIINPATLGNVAGNGIVLSSTLVAVLLPLFWICFKAGEFSFGTGLAIIPLLHGELVTTMQWLTNQEFLDGVTLGQVTPGPTSISIVFFGYKIAGFLGLLVAVVAFYLPPFINTLLLLPLLWHRLSKSKAIQIFITYAFPAIIGGIISSTFDIGYHSLISYYDYFLMLLALVIVVKKIMPTWLVIPLYGIIGLLFGFIIN